MSLIACALLPHPKGLIRENEAVAKKYSATKTGFLEVKKELEKNNVEILVVFAAKLLQPMNPYSPTPSETSAYYAQGLDQIEISLPTLDPTRPAIYAQNYLPFVDKVRGSIRPFGMHLKSSPNIKMDELSSLGLSLLNPNLKKTKVVLINLPFRSLNELNEFGKIIGRLAEQAKEKMAIVGIGDLSSQLASTISKKSQSGKDFDSFIQEAANKSQFNFLFSLDAQKIEQAGENAIRPLAALAGAATKLKSRLISYQAVEGIGHAVILWS